MESLDLESFKPHSDGDRLLFDMAMEFVSRVPKEYLKEYKTERDGVLVKGISVKLQPLLRGFSIEKHYRLIAPFQGTYSTLFCRDFLPIVRGHEIDSKEKIPYIKKIIEAELGLYF